MIIYQSTINLFLLNILFSFNTDFVDNFYGIYLSKKKSIKEKSTSIMGNILFYSLQFIQFSLKDN